MAATSGTVRAWPFQAGSVQAGDRPDARCCWLIWMRRGSSVTRWVRIYRRLINEHAMYDMSYQVVRAYVAKRKPETRVEVGRGPAQVFIEQSHLAGAEVEVGFGEVAVRLRASW